MTQLLIKFTIFSFIIFSPNTIKAQVEIKHWENKENGLPCSVDIDYTKCYQLENNQTILVKSSNSDENSIEQDWEETIQ
ncbi:MULTISPECIES: hypothetical protein [Arsenophonus]|jgi:hypothetical protein|uniref:hypothetical protein n=1 Tax=Arsenophonus TaxID=637 RepID=UPI0015D6AB93|nr:MULTISPECIES: hypothetical protein [Arsenophonus]UBX28765.1 hypothetical protein LDL57_13415 [Arsenophonus apicola]